MVQALGERIRSLAQSLTDAQKSMQSMKDEAQAAAVGASGRLLQILNVQEF